MAKNGDEVLNQTTQSVAAETKKREGKLKYGIIGTGWIAESHIQSLPAKWTTWKSSPLADLIPGKAEAFAEQLRRRRRAVLSGSQASMLTSGKARRGQHLHL